MIFKYLLICVFLGIYGCHSQKKENNTNTTISTINEEIEFSYIIFGFTERSPDHFIELLFKLEKEKVRLFKCNAYKVPNFDCNNLSNLSIKAKKDFKKLYNIPERFKKVKTSSELLKLNDEAFFTIKYYPDKNSEKIIYISSDFSDLDISSIHYMNNLSKSIDELEFKLLKQNK